MACCSGRSDYEHSYPHCWRCGTPLIYYAKPSWYIATTAVRDRLLAANETVGWHPPHIKHGRFGDWLAEQRRLGALARALLGHAAAGVALRAGHVHAIGSFAGAGGALGQTLADHHRPYVDEVEFPCTGAAASSRCDGCRR